MVSFQAISVGLWIPQNRFKYHGYQSARNIILKIRSRDSSPRFQGVDIDIQGFELRSDQEDQLGSFICLFLLK